MKQVAKDRGVSKGYLSGIVKKVILFLKIK